MTTSSTTEAGVTLGRLRKWLLAILVFGMAGTTADLLLQKHYEDATQLIPLILIGFALIVVTWHLLGRSRSSLMFLQLVMVLFVASGGLGMFFHYRATSEFQLEIEPDLAGSKLFWRVLQAKTPPALAPAIMAQLGLVGLAYAYRHPAIARRHNHVEENWSE